MRYPVRCCCKPTTLLGWIDGPEAVSRFKVHEQRDLPLPPLVHVVRVGEIVDRRKIVDVPGGYDPVDGSQRIEIVELDEPLLVERAVYSDDRPLEFWRRVQGFVEAKA